jgi:thiosulfate/3-mercaptopyruvate sulfurtransferase
MPASPVISAHALSGLAELVLLDCRVDPDAYRVGHLPHAQHAQLERDLSAPAQEPARGGRHPLPSPDVFASTLGRWGVRPDTQVVAYDDQNGANAAARLWWLLKAFGHESVQVVDGGLTALRAAGFSLTSTVDPVQPTAAYPIPRTWLRPTADSQEVERARTASDRRVIDVRAAVRYRGEQEPIDPIAGHIPGAHNVPLTENLRPDGTFKSPAELHAMYSAALAGVAPEHSIIHCGSGVTACHTLLALDRAGLSGAQLYVGSWSEWCRNPWPRDPS